MCSNRASLISPAMFREFFMPGYKRYIGGLKDLGVQQVFIDTDGDARLILPELIECGFTGVHPCEIKAGMDPGAIRERSASAGMAKGKTGQVGLPLRSLYRIEPQLRRVATRCFRLCDQL